MGAFDDFLNDCAEDTVNNGSGEWAETKHCLRCDRTSGTKDYCNRCEGFYREMDYLDNECEWLNLPEED